MFRKVFRSIFRTAEAGVPLPPMRPSLDGKPVAAALLRHSDRVDADARAFLAGLTASGAAVRPFTPATELDEKLANGLASCINDMIGSGLQSLGRPSSIAMLTALPPDAPAIVAFAALLMLGLVADLKLEGIDIKPSVVSTAVAKVLFVSHSADELMRHWQAGIVFLHDLAARPDTTFKSRQDTISVAAKTYVIEFSERPDSPAVAQARADIDKALRGFLSASR